MAPKCAALYPLCIGEPTAVSKFNTFHALHHLLSGSAMHPCNSVTLQNLCFARHDGKLRAGQDEARAATDLSVDVFGRGKVAEARDNRLGAGSFERDCRTLYVNYSGAVSHMQTGLQVSHLCLPGPSTACRRTWLQIKMQYILW